MDDLLAGTHVMSGRWVDTMKTPTDVEFQVHSEMVTRNFSSDEGCNCRAIRMLLARCLDKRGQQHESFVADYTQAFLNAEVREGEQLYVQPPEGRTPKLLHDGRRVVWKERKAVFGLRTSPRRWQEHLSNKLK